MMLLHPREATLLRYAAGSAQETARRRVASHLADCDRCRSTVQSTREIRVALASGAAVGAPDLLLQRILQSRMQGERVILPAETPAPRVTFKAPSRGGTEPQVRPAFWVILGGVAAVALVQVGTANLDNFLERREGGNRPVPAVVDGKTRTQRQRERILRDLAIPTAGPVVAARLRPIKLRYGSVDYNGVTPESSNRSSTFSIVRSPEIEKEWILISEYPRNYRRKPDSIWINAETLEPTLWRIEDWSKNVKISRTFTMSDGLVHAVASFAPNASGLKADTLLARVKSTYGPIDTIFAVRPETPQSPRIAQNQAHFIALMMTIPLKEGWSGRFGTIAVGHRFAQVNSQRTVTITGSKSVVTPAGVFECWEAAEREGGGYVVRWFRKSDGVFVGESAGDPNSVFKSQTLLLSEE